MGTACCGMQKFLGAALLAILCVIGITGTGKAATPGAPSNQQPEILRQMAANVVGLRFFATLKNKPDNKPNRVYKKYFLQDEAHYIWYELHLDARAKRTRPLTLKIQASLHIPGESPLKREHVFNIPPELRQIYLTGSCKADMPEGGWWFPGSYRLVLLIDNQEIASGSFEVGMY